VQSAKACHDGALAYSVPFISGKDSLNNEFVTDDGRTIAIPPTLLISAISVIDDVSRCVTADAKGPGNLIYLVGATTAQLGGSHFLLAEGKPSGTDLPPVDPAANLATMRAVQQAIAAGAVRACHDLSEGGLAVAAAEMAFSGGLGIQLDLSALQARNLPLAALLFAENAGRFLLEVPPDKIDLLEELLAGQPHARLGALNDTGRLTIAAAGRTVIDVEIARAKSAWQKTFAKF
jgi:phosphoribosylformylglycinamidine synthase